jgi:hypothetical protein
MSDETVETINLEAVPAETAATTKKERKPRTPKPAAGPNPYGIHNDKGYVITLPYLKKYFQCSTRGETYSLNRAENMMYFMSDEFLKQHAGESAGKLGGIVARDDRWFDETHPRPAAKARVAKEKSVAGETAKTEKKAKGKKQANSAAVEAASLEEATIIDGGQVVNF